MQFGKAIFQALPKLETLSSVLDGDKFSTSDFFRVKCYPTQSGELLFLHDFVKGPDGTVIRVNRFFLDVSDLAHLSSSCSMFTLRNHPTLFPQ